MEAAPADAVLGLRGSAGGASGGSSSSATSGPPRQVNKDGNAAGYPFGSSERREVLNESDDKILETYTE